MVLLIIDRSELFSQRLLELLLERVPTVAAYCITDGEGTLAKIDSVKPDAVLLELSLLSHRTLAILRYLREQEKVPLIIVTFIVADAYTLEQCRMAGADHLLDKYSDFEEIPKLIENR